MDELKQLLIPSLCKALKGTGIAQAVDVAALLEAPPDPALGDLAFPCFIFAKELKQSPGQIAGQLAASFQTLPSIEKVATQGPYVNFFFSPIALAHHVFAKTKRQRKQKRETVVIEYVSPNTNKPLHLGHVRNAVLGDSIARILESEGKKVVRTCLVNDRGIHICKSMVAYNIQNQGKLTPRAAGMKGDHFVGGYYVLFEKMLKENPSLTDEALACLKKWEGGDRTTRALWKKMNAWVLSGMKETYGRLGVSFDKTYFESGIYDKGRDIIVKQLKKGVVTKNETGAVVADLSSEQLPEKVLLRRDGTTLYITQDIFLAIQKHKDFAAAASLYVIGSEQNLYMQQLFAVLRKFGYAWAARLTHVSYGMVNLPEGKMKSREGTVVDADDLLDELETLAQKEVVNRDATLSKKEVGRRAKVIALAALKFYMVDVNPKSDMTFNPAASLSFQGHTGPYILYTIARLKSILNKVAAHTRTPAAKKHYDWLAEKPILLALLNFGAMRERAAQSLNPALVSQYLFDLAQKINDYYHATPVLNAEERARTSRLRLIAAGEKTLTEGLALLGIEALERM